MATLSQLRTKLNGEIGVVTDGEAAPWSSTVRNNAIIDGYAELWRVGVRKPATQDIASVTDQDNYTLTTIRALKRIELLDTAGRIVDRPRGIVEDDGAGGWRLRLAYPVVGGYTLRVSGWTPYKSQFSGDGDTDDLPAEHNRIPLLKAKAILYRAQLATFARFQQSQSIPKSMQVTPEILLGLVAAAEREFAEEAKVLAGQRPRVGQLRRI